MLKREDYLFDNRKVLKIQHLYYHLLLTRVLPRAAQGSRGQR